MVIVDTVSKIISCVSSQTSEDLAELEEAKTRLHEKMQDVMDRIDDVEAEESELPSSDEVREWLKKAQVSEYQADEFIKTWAQKNKSYRGGNFKQSVSEQLRLMNELLKESPHVTKVAERRLSKDLVDRRPVEQGIVGQDRLFDEIMERFRENHVGIIGLAGKGGVGKTTLLREISKTVYDDSNKFDRVIWVDMSKATNTGKVQDTIAKQIGLYDESWEQKQHLDAKAKDISTVLKGKKFALFLDDIWEWCDFADLRKVGVPLSGIYNGVSKMVFTTCSSASYDRIRADTTFEVACLKREDAWKLFKSKVGEVTLRSHPLIHDLAELVVKGCHGLPLALKVVGVAMSAKMTLQEWDHAAFVASGCLHLIEGEVFRALKISYDSLLGDTMRSCFLYCSLFSEDYSISKRDLIDYWIGEGLVKERSGARREGNNIIDHLVRACLLEEDDDADHVKLHPVIHKMAVGIRSEINREEHFVLVAGSRRHEMKTWKRAKRISITRVDQCSATSCPELLTLFLNHTSLKVIPNGFFQVVPSLKVLNLSKNPYLAVLPEEIASLASLEHLDLSRTNIRELAEEMKALEKLKCLNLENTSKLHTIPRQLVSSFSMLQVLRMLNCGSSEATKGSLLYDDGIFLIGELLCLQRLEMLSINLTSPGALDMFLKSRELQRSTQSLCVRFLEFSKPLKLFVANMESLDTVSISDCGDLEDLKIDCGGVLMQEVPLGFYSLKVVVISSCPRLKDLTWLIFALNLERLEVSNCPNMQEIIDAAALSTFPEAVRKLDPFLMLEYLELRQLPTLRRIHEECLPFPKLKKIKIVQCSKLETRQLASVWAESCGTS